MKLVAAVCASFVAVAALTLTTNAAFAATTVKSSKSNAASFKACVDGGGTVKKDAKGNQDCTPKKK
jgi:type IV secretory pathway TrbL component